MRRRTFLASSVPALAGIASLAGCLGEAGSPGTSPAPGTGAGPATTEPTEPGPSSRTSPPTEPGVAPAPPPATDVFADIGCPSFVESADRTVCYHAVDPSSADVVLGVDPEVFDPDLGDSTIETLTFTLYNRSEWHFHFNPYGWGIERLEDGTWDHVEPEAVNPLLTVMPPGETHAWELPSQVHPTPRDDDRMVLDVALPAGVYAFHIHGSFGTDLVGTSTPTDEPPEERVECVGLFRLAEDVDPGSPGGTPRATETGTAIDE